LITHAGEIFASEAISQTRTRDHGPNMGHRLAIRVRGSYFDLKKSGRGGP
jgi:hypothetical protein